MSREMKIQEKYHYLCQRPKSVGQAAERLDEVIGILRKECPWDRVQTHHSLRPYLLEEAYEVCEAIDTEDSINLREELGDVLLQVVLHAAIAQEEGLFDWKDVINEECDKMLRRHPHVFSDEKAKTVDKVVEKWENVKSKEHGNATQTERLSDVPKALPSLTRSQKVQKRAGDAGLDWKDIAGPLAKIREELDEWEEALATGEREAMSEELGDLLFSVVNAARHAGLDPEASLHKATDKFIKRFRSLEIETERQGIHLAEADISVLDALWEKIKNRA